MPEMGNVRDIGCTPTLAHSPGCTPTLAPNCKNEDCFDPCTPALANRALDPLSDQECADIALVQATVRGEPHDVVRALSLGASPNTIAELTLRMGEPSKKGRRGRAVHMTPLMRACELGHEDVVMCLLKGRASALQCDSHGWTPLCHALGAGEVRLARLLASQPGFKLERQKEICRKLQAEILSKCEVEASPEALAAVEAALGPGGVLDAGADAGASCAAGPGPGGPVVACEGAAGASGDKVPPLPPGPVPEQADLI